MPYSKELNLCRVKAQRDTQRQDSSSYARPSHMSISQSTDTRNSTTTSKSTIYMLLNPEDEDTEDEDYHQEKKQTNQQDMHNEDVTETEYNRKNMIERIIDMSVEKAMGFASVQQRLPLLLATIDKLEEKLQLDLPTQCILPFRRETGLTIPIKAEPETSIHSWSWLAEALKLLLLGLKAQCQQQMGHWQESLSSCNRFISLLCQYSDPTQSPGYHTQPLALIVPARPCIQRPANIVLSLLSYFSSTKRELSELLVTNLRTCMDKLLLPRAPEASSSHTLPMPPAFSDTFSTSPSSQMICDDDDEEEEQLPNQENVLRRRVHPFDIILNSPATPYLRSSTTSSTS